jgi:uncharacterized membrane protein YbhN (UPF0104 family)
VSEVIPGPGRRAWTLRIALLIVAVVVLWTVVRLVGRVDWSAVGTALSHLDWWQLAVLVVVLVVRQVFNALPLALFIEGVSVFRATINDLGAILMSMIAPPPSDIAMRVTMFSSWGVAVSRGIAGAALNTLTFYIIRFSAPVLGFLAFLGWRGDAGSWWAALAGGLVAGAILAGLILVIRGDGPAVWVGTTAGRLARRVRRSVDPDSWAAACLRFRVDMVSTFRRGFVPSLLGLLIMLAADATILVLSLRFVGVSASEVPTLDVVAAYLVAYPLTLFPISGIGILDAVLLAVMVDVGGQAVEPGVLAALMVWRVFTVLGPVAMGAGAVLWWRRTQPSRRSLN